MLRYFYLNSDIIDLLLRSGRIDILQHTFYDRATGLQLSDQLPIPEAYLTYAIKIRINMMCTILAHWVETGKREAPDELADTLKKLMEHQGTIDQFM